MELACHTLFNTVLLYLALFCLLGQVREANDSTGQRVGDFTQRYIIDFFYLFTLLTVSNMTCYILVTILAASEEVWP